MNASILEGYRDLLHLLLVHEYRNDNAGRVDSIERAIADFKHWLSEDAAMGELIDALVSASQIYDNMRHP